MTVPAESSQTIERSLTESEHRAERQSSMFENVLGLIGRIGVRSSNSLHTDYSKRGIKSRSNCV